MKLNVKRIEIISQEMASKQRRRLKNDKINGLVCFKNIIIRQFSHYGLEVSSLNLSKVMQSLKKIDVQV